MDPWEIARPADAGFSFGENGFGLPKSASGISATCYKQFFLGSFLAHIHSHGFKYTDFHSDNLGYLASSGFTVIDPGGMIETELNPDEMAGDFLVPLSELSPDERIAFVVGYRESALVLLDAKTPNYTQELLRQLGFDSESSEYPCTRTRIDFLVSTLTLSPCPRGNDDVRPDERLTAAIACVVIAQSAASHEIKSLYIRRLLSRIHPPIDAQKPAVTRLRDIKVSESDQAEFIELCALATDEFPLNAGEVENASAVFWPRASFSEKLSYYSHAEERSPHVRETIIDTCIALGWLASQSSDRDSFYAFTTLFTLTFSLSATDSVEIAAFEERHRKTWLFFNKQSNARCPDHARMSLENKSDALALSSMYCEAARFELAFWGASFAQSLSTGSSICWHAYASTFEYIRRAYLACFYGLYFFDPTEPLMTSFTEIMKRILRLHRHCISCLTHPKLDISPAAMSEVWGSNLNRVTQEASWIEELETQSEQWSLNPKKLMQQFLAGKQYFMYIDQIVITCNEKFTHQKQSVYGGIKRESLES